MDEYRVPEPLSVPGRSPLPPARTVAIALRSRGIAAAGARGSGRPRPLQHLAEPLEPWCSIAGNPPALRSPKLVHRSFSGGGLRDVSVVRPSRGGREENRFARSRRGPAHPAYRADGRVDRCVVGSAALPTARLSGPFIRHRDRDRPAAAHVAKPAPRIPPPPPGRYHPAGDGVAGDADCPRVWRDSTNARPSPPTPRARAGPDTYRSMRPSFRTAW